MLDEHAIYFATWMAPVVREKIPNQGRHHHHRSATVKHTDTGNTYGGYKVEDMAAAPTGRKMNHEPVPVATYGTGGGRNVDSDAAAFIERKHVKFSKWTSTAVDN